MENIKKIFGSAFAAATTANLAIFASGNIFCWTSPTGPKLTSNDPTINPLALPTTILQESLLASIILPGCLVGALAAGLSTNKIGKKKTLLIFAMPIFVGHLICAFAHNINVFLSARFVMGVGAGCEYAVLPAYVSEIVTDKNRGAFGTLVSVLAMSGNLYVYSIGPFTSVQWFSLLNLIPLVLFFGLFSFCVESPYELVELGEKEKAVEALMLLRKTDSKADIEKELFFIEETVKIQTQEYGYITDFFKDKTLRKALTITCTVMLFQQSSGISAVLAYMQTIFESSKFALPANYSPILVCVFAVAANSLSSQLIDRLGRKLCLLISMISLIVTNGTLGIYFFFKSKNFDVTAFSWLPVVCLILFFIFYAVGLSSVPWILIGEYFPASHKRLASTITTFACFAFSGIVTLCFPFINASLGEAGSFSIFCLVLSFGVIFILLGMPETKGMTFLEVQDVLSGVQKIDFIK